MTCLDEIREIARFRFTIAAIRSSVNRMADMKQLLIVVAVLVGFASAVDPRVCALRGRDLEQLKMICNKASVPFEADADEEKLRSILFEYMQNELPETIRPKGTPLEPWPGPGQPGECDDPKSMKPNPGSTPKLEHMAARLFNRLDKNSDDMLQRDEMRAMLDEINAAARAKGEPEHDLFKTLDRDQDGKVSRTEAEETFKAMAAKMMQSTSTPASKAGSKDQSPGMSEHDMADGMFTNLDANKDGQLSKAEMKAVLEQFAAQQKAEGEDEVDFWASLDADTNGYLSKTEVQGFIAAMMKAAKQGGDKEDL